MATIPKITQSEIRKRVGKAKQRSYLTEDGSKRDSVPGFGVRFTANRATYVLRYRGRTHRLAPWSNGVPPQEIRPIAERLRLELASSALVQEELGSGRTLAQVFPLHLDHLQVKPSTEEEYKRLWRVHILPELGDRRIGDLSPLDVERWLRARRDTPAAANRALQQLDAALRFAKRMGWLQRLPTDGVSNLREKKKRRRLTAEELQRLMKVLDKAEREGTVRLGPLAVTWCVLLTGCRPFEVRDAPLGYAHLSATVPRIEWPPGEAKGDRRGAERGRIVILTPRCVEALKKVPRDSEETWLIPGAHSGTHLKSLRKPLARLRKLSKIPDLSFRALRTTYRSEAKAARVPGSDVQLLVGHAPGSPMTDEVYLVERLEELQEQAQHMESHLLEVG